MYILKAKGKYGNQGYLISEKEYYKIPIKDRQLFKKCTTPAHPDEIDLSKSADLDILPIFYADLDSSTHLFEDTSDFDGFDGGDFGGGGAGSDW